jgi:hypothetical protein
MVQLTGMECDVETNLKWTAAGLFFLAFALRASGQTTSSKPALPVAIDRTYDAQAKVLLLHATNNSGKDIVAYSIRVQPKLPDGSLDKRGWSRTQTDMLSTLVRIQMANDPAAESFFAAGTTRDIPMPKVDSPNVEVAFDAVFYADGSFDGGDTDSFKSILASRQGQLLEMKKANEIMRAVLADTSVDHPIAVVITELAKAAGESLAHNPSGANDPESNQDRFFHGDLMSLRNLLRSGPECEVLVQYVERREKEAELMTPHCHLEIALK